MSKFTTLPTRDGKGMRYRYVAKKIEDKKGLF
jgi:hypothetical protein